MSWLGNENDDIAGDLGFSMHNTMMQRTLVGRSQFFAFEQFYLPDSIKQLFEFSAHMMLTNDAINPAIEKLAEYPITKFTFSPRSKAKKDTQEYQDEMESKEELRHMWENIFDDHLMAKSYAIKASMNFYTYGNHFASVYQPFDRILICGNPQCREHHPLIAKMTKWDWDKARLAFVLKCQKCGFKGQAKVLDKISRDVSRINLISFYPGNIDIDYDPYSGCREYYYTIPDEEVEKIKKGNRLKLEKTPWDIIQAVKLSRGKSRMKPKIKLKADNVFHLNRQTFDMPGAENTWGMPITVAALRNIFYLNMMKRAQLALMLDHILPFRMIFPAADVGANTTMPMDLADWRRRMTKELKKWKRDPLYIMLAPIPMGQDQVGGQGKALMLFPEMEQVRNDIITSLNVPQEFVKGGLQYTGSSVSLRMLENQLLNQVEQVIKMFKWVMKRVSQIAQIDQIDVDMVRFKMSDDVQAKQMMVNLWMQGGLSGETLGNICDFDYASEMRKRTQENLAKAVMDAKAQAEAANKMMVLQSLLQQALPPEMTVTAPPVDPNMVEQVYQGLGTLDPEQQSMYVQQIGAQNPAMARELSTRASTDMNGYGQTMQTMLAMNPQERLGAMEQMQQQNPVQALILANLMKAFNMEDLMGSMGGGGQSGGEGGPSKPKKPGQEIEKNNPEKKPPRREGGSPM